MLAVPVMRVPSSEKHLIRSYLQQTAELNRLLSKKAGDVRADYVREQLDALWHIMSKAARNACHKLSHEAT